MNDKYAKEIAKELRLIRLALQGHNTEIAESVKEEFANVEQQDNAIAGERVTIK